MAVLFFQLLKRGGDASLAECGLPNRAVAGLNCELFITERALMFMGFECIGVSGGGNGI